ISAVILSVALVWFGKSIEIAGSHAAQRQPIRIPNRLTLSTQNMAPVILRIENSPGGASLKIETEQKNR
ncbi:hypothetical protein LCGC14_1668860, partial [marine sediment metagenome]